MKWKKGDIVQINPEYSEKYGACFMVVSQPIDGGAKGFFVTHGSDTLEFYRVPEDGAVKVGKLAFYPCDIFDIEDLD